MQTQLAPLHRGGGARAIGHLLAGCRDGRVSHLRVGARRRAEHVLRGGARGYDQPRDGRPPEENDE